LRSNEPMSRMGTLTKRCRCVDRTCDWPAASRPETVGSRCEARMLCSQRFTRQKFSSDVRRMNQPLKILKKGKGRSLKIPDSIFSKG
jgi:hypothetical protein